MHKLITIDDEVEFTNFIKNFFEPRGFEVFVAHNGEDGLALAKSINPDVALVDLKMPGKRGDQVMLELKQFNPKIKVIMITASEGYGQTRDKLLVEGAFACFDKPITSIAELDQKVKEAVR
jgi:DNA-binding response OmpR family regulator